MAQGRVRPAHRGAGGAIDAQPAIRGQVHLGFDWKPAETWLVHAHGVAQGEPSSYGGQRAGLVEGFVQFRPELTAKERCAFAPASSFPRPPENVDPLWQSPYTVTLSSLNTWLGEEVRLTGLETVWVRRATLPIRAGRGGVRRERPRGGAPGLARLGPGRPPDHLGRGLPLPPLSTFAPGQAFADQREDGTRPVDELDSRLGYEARARLTRPDAFRIQAAFYDNRADRRLRRGQYSWQTRFAQAGFEASSAPASSSWPRASWATPEWVRPSPAVRRSRSDFARATRFYPGRGAGGGSAAAWTASTTTTAMGPRSPTRNPAGPGRPRPSGSRGPSAPWPRVRVRARRSSRGGVLERRPGCPRPPRALRAVRLAEGMFRALPLGSSKQDRPSAPGREGEHMNLCPAVTVVHLDRGRRLSPLARGR